MAQRSPSPHPDWAVKFRKPGTELRRIKDKYYLYEYKTIYDPVKKRPKKVSGKLLGRITEKGGFIESAKNKLRKQQALQPRVGPVRESGISQYILGHFKDFYEQLASCFPHQWQDLVLMAYCRLLYQSPIKRMPYHIQQSWLAEEWEVQRLTDKKISGLLRSVGRQRDQAVAYMRAFIEEGEFLLVDTTHILSKSSHIQLSKKGYSNQLDYEPQINTMYLYSAQNRMPVFYRLHGGNIREVKAFRLTLEESGVGKGIIIGDKGFYSKQNTESLHAEGLQYIIPLKRDSQLLNYDRLKDNTLKNASQFFEYEKRFIWYEELPVEDPQPHRVILFLDETLRLKEENDYLRRIRTHPEEYSQEGYLEKRNRFGTMGIISNLKQKSAQELFFAYKARMAIEEMFDSLKNVLDADSTYMQNEDALQGWMFVNHLALQWYQQIYLLLKERKLNAKYSVKDFLLLLRDIRKVKINNQWLQAEVTNSTIKLLEKINLNI